MEREIVNLQVGQCGNQIGTRFWQTILEEHGIDSTGKYIGTNDLQLERINVYFAETDSNNYVPRTVLVDLDPRSLDVVRSGPVRALFNPNNFICGQNCGANNWARGHYKEGAELCKNILEAVRREVERCDLCQGFQLTQSLCGGTESGLGSQLVLKLKNEFKYSMVTSFSVVPSPKEFQNGPLQAYNTVLSLKQLIENTVYTHCIDYSLRESTMTNSDLNYLISLVMSGVTTSFRFPGKVNSDLSKFAMNMVPFPPFHFFVPGFAPLTAPGNELYSVKNLTQQVFKPTNLMAACNIASGRFFGAAAIFRGQTSMKEVDHAMLEFENRNSSNYVQGVPHKVQTTVCNIPSTHASNSCTFIANSTAIQGFFRRTQKQFSAMFKPKAFMHRYRDEGMEEQAFIDAQTTLVDFISEYQKY